MPRKKIDDGLTLFTTFRLSSELHELLLKAAVENHHGIGAEIRQRVARSFLTATVLAELQNLSPETIAYLQNGGKS